MDLIWTLCRTSNLPFAIHFQLVTVGSILAHILTSKKCLIVHSAWQSWSQSISKHILFCKYCISQFIDIRSCFVLLVQRANELNSGNHRRAFQREWWKLTKVTHICQLISFFFFSSVWNAFFCRFERNYRHESQTNIAFLARSKQKIYKPYFGVNKCIGINCFSLPVPVLNQIESNKAGLVT